MFFLVTGKKSNKAAELSGGIGLDIGEIVGGKSQEGNLFATPYLDLPTLWGMHWFL